MEQRRKTGQDSALPILDRLGNSKYKPLQGELILRISGNLLVRLSTLAFLTIGIAFLLMAINRSPSETRRLPVAVPSDWLKTFTFKSDVAFSEAESAVFVILYSQGCLEAIGEAAEYSHILREMSRELQAPRFVPVLLVVHEDPTQAARLLTLLEPPIAAAYGPATGVPSEFADDEGLIDLQQIYFVSKNQELFYSIPIQSVPTEPTEKRERIREALSVEQPTVP